MSIIGQNIGHLTFWEDAKCLINWYLKYSEKCIVVIIVKLRSKQ